MPTVIKRSLVNDDFDISVGYRTAEIILGVDVDFHHIAQLKGFLFAVFLRGLNRYLKLRQFVFLQPEQGGTSNMLAAPLRPEGDAVLAQRDFF